MADLASRLSPFGFLFGKSLSDLIHGIRRCAPEERAEFLREVVNECRDEVRSTNLNVKTTAVLKLAYLEMLGYDMSWSGFHVVEVMASPHFQQKRIGYLAAMQSFRGDAELTVLVTNLLKMDLVSSSSPTVSIALSGLATIVSPLLAADVADDIMKMLAHSQPYIRKKAVLALHNVVLEYPDVLDEALKRIADLFDAAQADPSDPDNVSVVSATVSVICELATHARSIQNFLELTPKLFAVFSTSQHNWTLIKLLKVFKLFVQREPRLKARLLPAIRTTMVTSEATSLVYESAACLVQMVESQDADLAGEIISALQNAAQTRDANLAFIFVGILTELAKINPSFVPTDLVSALLTEQQSDPVTRKRALKLAQTCVNDDTLFDFVTELTRQLKLADRTTQRDIAEALADMVAVDGYEYVPDFEWLVKVFAEVANVVTPPALANRLVDIAIRVPDPDVRAALGEACRDWLKNNDSLAAGDPLTADDAVREAALFADTCWWIIGEFPSPSMLSDPLGFIEGLDGVRISPALATCVAKLVTKASNVENRLLDAAIEFLEPLAFSPDFELQERSCEFLELLKLARSSPDQTVPLLYSGLASLFAAYELTPVAPNAQRQVPRPDIDLDTPVAIDPMSESDSSSESESEESGNVSDSELSEASDVESVDAGETVGADAISSEELRREAEQRAKETQLFNLARLETQQKERPQKKKVPIMKDSTPTGQSSPATATPTSITPEPSPAPSTKLLFRSGFSHEPNDLLVDSEPPAPVKVKHKHKKKHK